METNQDVGTDLQLFQVLNEEFSFVLDLAATKENTKCALYLDKGSGWLGHNPGVRDPLPPDGTESAGGSLDVPWHHWNGWLWLNPPYRDIAPWAKKCMEEAALGAKVAMLVPAAVDSEWFEKYVWKHAEVRWLRSRPVFDFVHLKDGTLDKKTGKPRYRAGDKNTDPYPKPCQVCLFEKGRAPEMLPWNWRALLPKKAKQ